MKEAAAGTSVFMQKTFRTGGPTSQSSSAYTHEAGRHRLSKSILLSQGLAASLARAYPKGFEAIEKPLRSPSRCRERIDLEIIMRI
jgi:hypothetical protein